MGSVRTTRVAFCWLLLLLLSACCHDVVLANVGVGSNNSTAIELFTDYEPYFPSPATCSSVPACSHLAADCCPTSYAGIFLDCCSSEGTTATASSCSANPGCAGLQGDCCPPAPGEKDLYCCYASGESGYERDFTFTGHPDLLIEAIYFTSTGLYTEIPSSSNNQWKVDYLRNVNQQYDLVYFRTDAIPNAYEYVTGERKFYITIDATTAPPCTQLILQLDVLPTAQPDNYPIGRHSRYLATYTNTNGGRLEFDFLDRPDPTVSDTDVNAMALLLDPGVFTEQRWQWSFLDSARACTTGASCQASPVKRCAALHVGETTSCADTSNNDPNVCANPACTTAAACAKSYVESYLALEDNRQTLAASATLGARTCSGLLAVLLIAIHLL